MAVAVTGASGFIGGAVARALQSRGTPVLSVGRTDPRIPCVRHIEWDITSSVPLSINTMAGRVESVVHAAALVDDWGSEAEFQAVNVTGTRHVLDAFPRARFIHLSSSAVYDPYVHHVDVHEEAAPLDESRYAIAYERSKALAEVVVKRVRPDALVLRPHGVYGAGDRPLLPRLLATARKGKLRLPGGGRRRTTLTHIDNLVAAVLAGLERPDVKGAVNVGDPETYVLREALNTYLARVGADLLEFDSMATDLALVSAWASEKRARFSKSRPVTTRFAVRNIVRDRTYHLGRLQEVLGVSPVQGLSPLPEDQFADDENLTQRIELDWDSFDPSTMENPPAED